MPRLPSARSVRCRSLVYLRLLPQQFAERLEQIEAFRSLRDEFIEGLRFIDQRHVDMGDEEFPDPRSGSLPELTCSLSMKSLP